MRVSPNTLQTCSRANRLIKPLIGQLRRSLSPCQQLRVVLAPPPPHRTTTTGTGTPGPHHVEFEDGSNRISRVCFAVSCLEYDVKTVHRTTYAAGHAAFAKRVAARLCDPSTPTLEYRRCLEWLSWIQHAHPRTTSEELPLDQSSMAMALSAALECRDADTFRQLAALLTLYSSISESAAAAAEQATLSILPRARFSSSALAAAYVDLLRVLCGPGAGGAQGRSAAFLSAMRSAAAVLASCASVPIRVRLDLNDVFLYPSLSECVLFSPLLRFPRHLPPLLSSPPLSTTLASSALLAQPFLPTAVGSCANELSGFQPLCTSQCPPPPPPPRGCISLLLTRHYTPWPRHVLTAPPSLSITIRS
jgi:hypothetical protein